MKSVRISSSATAALLLLFLFTRCSKNASGPMSSAENLLIQKPWTVDYYFNSQDMTGNFASSRLLFSSTGAVGYQKGGETIGGEWIRSLDASSHELISLQFDTNDASVEQLNRAWKLVDQTSNTLQFEQADGIKTIVFRLKAQ